MKPNFNLYLSFALYGLGLLCMFFADLFIAANYTSEDVAKWAFYKSALFIMSAFCLLGLDQVMIRAPDHTQQVTRRFFVNTIGVSTSFYIVLTYYNKLIVPLDNLILSVCLFSLITFVGAYYRAKNRLVAAQLSTNGWKVIVFTLMVISIGSVDVWFLISFFIAILLLAPLILFGKKSEIKLKTDDLTKDYNRLGLAFLLHSLTLVVAVHGEQFIITLLGNDKVAYIVFSHFVIFTPVAISINGFLGFYLAPKIRRKSNFNLSSYQKYNLRMNILSLTLATVSLVIGAIIYYIVFFPKGLKLDLTIVFFLFLICLARGKYTFASVCLNVFASQRILMATAALNWLSMVLYLAALILVLNSSLDNSIQARLIATSTAIHWFARSLASSAFAKKSIVKNNIANESKK